MKKVENMTVERKMKQRKKKEKHLCKVLVKEAGLVITSLSQIEAEKKSSIQNTHKGWDGWGLDEVFRKLQRKHT